MPSSSSELSRLRARYREIFNAVRERLDARLLAERADFVCPTCDGAGDAPPESLDDALSRLHPDCGFSPWARQTRQTLQHEIGQDVWRRLQAIDAYKKTFSCHMCGVCCRFASSEFSFEALQEKARQGDVFAKQFTSIFLPYDSPESARARFPAIVDDVLSHAGPDETIHFFHCPYVGEDNRCTIYGSERRPPICDTYPDTPLTFIYERCAWKPWQEETSADALAAHATIELASYYVRRLERAATPDAS